MVCAEVFYTGLILVTEVVKPQAVALLVHDRTQSVLELSALCGINEALKHGVLNALTIIYALFSDFSQPAPAACILGIHVISYQNKHLPPHFHRNGGYSSKSSRRYRARSSA